MVRVRWWPVILLELMWNDPWWRSLLHLLFIAITYGKVSLWLWKSLENSGNFFLLLCGHPVRMNNYTLPSTLCSSKTPMSWQQFVQSILINTRCHSMYNKFTDRNRTQEMRFSQPRCGCLIILCLQWDILTLIFMQLGQPGPGFTNASSNKSWTYGSVICDLVVLHRQVGHCKRQPITFVLSQKCIWIKPDCKKWSNWSSRCIRQCLKFASVKHLWNLHRLMAHKNNNIFTAQKLDV